MTHRPLQYQTPTNPTPIAAMPAVDMVGQGVMVPIERVLSIDHDRTAT